MSTITNWMSLSNSNSPGPFPCTPPIVRWKEPSGERVTEPPAAVDPNGEMTATAAGLPLNRTSTPGEADDLFTSIDPPVQLQW